MKFIVLIALLLVAVFAQSYADNEHDDDSHACAQPLFALPKDAVACLADIPFWYHDHASGECKQGSYDGCNKNANHFETKEDCHKTCDEWHKEHKDHHHGHGKEAHEDCHDHAGHDHSGHDHSGHEHHHHH